MTPSQMTEALLEFRDAFNAGRYHKAHDILEVVWLAQRGRAGADCFKGLIQLAAAFVHVQRGRQGPALVLLARAGGYVAQSPGPPAVDVGEVLALATLWQDRLAQAGPEGMGPILNDSPPRLERMGEQS